MKRSLIGILAATAMLRKMRDDFENEMSHQL